MKKAHAGLLMLCMVTAVLAGDDLHPRFAQARKKYDTAVAKAQAEYDQSVVLARKQYAVDLDVALRVAMKEGDLEGANAIKAEQESLRAVVSGLPEDAVAFGEHHYKHFLEQVTWHEAAALCKKQGGHLLVIDSKEENEFIGSLIGTEIVWSGATDERAEGKWLTVLGKLQRFNGWTEPPSNSGGQEHYLAVDRRGWNDVPATFKYGYVCEWE